MNSQGTTRRNFLVGGALLATASTLGFGGMFGLRSVQAADGDDVQKMIDIAATAETFAATHYYMALKSKIRFTTPQLAYIKAAAEQELIHLEFLNSKGATSLADKFYFPKGTFNSATSFGLVSAIAETVFVGAYLAATRRFAELGNSLLAATAAQVAVIEAQHLALVRQTANELPNNIALGEAKFFNVSEAVPVLQPVLDGKQGGLGPMETTQTEFPGADAIRKVIGKSVLSPTSPFTEMSAGPSATTEATAAS
jgi:hypothetical protein